MDIIKGQEEHINRIRYIAEHTWADTYGAILSQEQIDYMLSMMYSPEALQKQMLEQNHCFLLVKDNNLDDFVGFVSYELDYKNEGIVKIHKLYVLSQCQGSGMGKVLLDEVARFSVESGASKLVLNMNRFNNTLGFYRHLGFEIIGEEDIDIGDGYLMEDYVFEKKLG
ncbi:MAG: hypothetical protein RL662_2237 [Bacteroidota bacterium]|jgi:ribosomal protein S18 acetylase RimI-like enzyme